MISQARLVTEESCLALTAILAMNPKLCDRSLYRIRDLLSPEPHYIPRRYQYAIYRPINRDLR
jgi:hypothetical protein